MSFAKFLPFLAIAFFASCNPGCAQNTQQPQTQTTPQRVDTNQDSKQGGSQANIYVINAPARGVSGEYASNQGDALTRSAKLTTGVADTGSAGSDAADATFMQHGIVLNVNQGGTTQTPTGSATGTLSGTSQAATATPNQEPKATVTVPIAVGAPGSAPQATGAGSLEGPASTSATNNAELRTLLERAGTANQQPGDMQRIRELILGGATSQPVKP